MSEDSSESPTKRNIQQKVETCLQTIEAVKQKYEKVIVSESASNSREIIFKALKACVTLHDLEKIINEAEMHDIYEDNAVYDKLVENHIKTLSSLKTLKKYLPLRNCAGMGAAGLVTVKKVRQIALGALLNGIRFRELEEVLLQVDIYLRCDEIFSYNNSNQTSGELSTLLSDLERHPEAVDAGLIESLRSKKIATEKINEKLKKLPKVNSLKEIRDEEYKAIVQEVKLNQIELKQQKELEALVKISEGLRHLYHYLVSEEMVAEDLNIVLSLLTEKTDQLQAQLKANKHSFVESFDEYSEKSCREIIASLPSHIKACELADEPLLLTFSQNLQSLLWRSHATRLLIRNEDSEKELEQCLRESSDTSSTEYSMISERLHGLRTAKVTEKKTKDRILEFWTASISELISAKSKVALFIKESKSFFNEKITDKQIEVLEETIRLFSSEQIRVQDLFNLSKQFEECAPSRSCSLFEEIKRFADQLERANQSKEAIEGVWRRAARTRKTLKENITIREVLSVPRLEEKKARDYLAQLKLLDSRLAFEFLETIDKLEANMAQQEELNREYQKFAKNWSLSYLRSLGLGKDTLNQAFSQYMQLMEGYLHVEIQDQAFEIGLEGIDNHLKAQALLLNLKFFTDLRRDISSWESIIVHLKNEAMVSEPLIQLMEEKLRSAERLLMEAHKMRQFESQSTKGGNDSQSKQAKLMSPAVLQQMLEKHSKAESVVELQDTTAYLERIFTLYNESVELIDKASSLRQLDELKDLLQKLPLMIDESVYARIEHRMAEPLKLREEIHQAIENNPDSLGKQMPIWKSRFEKFGIMVEEWQQLQDRHKEEMSFTSKISRLFQVVGFDVDDVTNLKKEYESHKFVKSGEIEKQLISAEISAIHSLYERRLFSEEKPGKLLDIEAIKELEKRTLDLFSKHPVYKDDSEMTKKLSFVSKLVKDLNKLIQDRIKGSNNLEELKLNSEQNPFKDIVDLSEHIQNHKVQLEKEAQKYGPGSVKTRQGCIDTLRLLMEKNQVFQFSNLDYQQTAKAIEKAIYERSMSRAKNYADYCRQVFKIMQRISGFTAISTYLQEKNFDLGLIEGLFSKSQQDFKNLEDSITSSKNNPKKVKPGHRAFDPYGYNYYKIFEGLLHFGLRDGKTTKKVEGTEILSCHPQALLEQFSSLNNRLQLSMNVKLEDFKPYIQKVMSHEQYLVLNCWAKFPTEQSAQAKTYMETNHLVATSQYSKTCKIIIFPKIFMDPSWIAPSEFFIAREDNEPIDFLAFLVLKKSVLPDFGEVIKPVTQPFKETSTFYQVYSISNQVLEKIINPNLLLQVPVAVDGQVLSEIGSENEKCDDEDSSESIQCLQQMEVKKYPQFNPGDDFYSEEDPIDQAQNYYSQRQRGAMVRNQRPAKRPIRAAPIPVSNSKPVAKPEPQVICVTDVPMAASQGYSQAYGGMQEESFQPNEDWENDDTQKPWEQNDTQGYMRNTNLLDELQAPGVARNMMASAQQIPGGYLYEYPNQMQQQSLGKRVPQMLNAPMQQNTRFQAPLAYQQQHQVANPAVISARFDQVFDEPSLVPDSAMQSTYAQQSYYQPPRGNNMQRGKIPAPKRGRGAAPVRPMRGGPAMGMITQNQRGGRVEAPMMYRGGSMQGLSMQQRGGYSNFGGKMEQQYRPAQPQNTTNIMISMGGRTAGQQQAPMGYYPPQPRQGRL